MSDFSFIMITCWSLILSQACDFFRKKSNVAKMVTIDVYLHIYVACICCYLWLPEILCVRSLPFWRTRYNSVKSAWDQMTLMVVFCSSNVDVPKVVFSGCSWEQILLITPKIHSFIIFFLKVIDFNPILANVKCMHIYVSVAIREAEMPVLII